MSHFPDMNQSADRDGDVHVINREHEFRNDDTHNDPSDTPNFLSSLDLPSPTGTTSNPNALFDEFDDNSKEGVNAPNMPVSADFQMSPGLSEFVTHDTELKLEEKPFNGTLTRFAGALPPLQPLSESIIGRDISLPMNPIVPDYVASGVNNHNRSQALLSSIQKKKKEPQGPKTRPAFVMKIWSMVNDPSNYEYIRWNEDGHSFKVVHREDFMKKILPKYFKHNNFASFVRQLNMYGWHKVQDISSGSLKDDRGLEEMLQFNNPYFIRGREDLLDNIVRNKTGSQEAENQESNSINFQLVINELDQIKLNQMAIIEDMRRMRSDNQTLWNESFTARERHQKQAQTLDKIMKFLAAVYGNSAGKIFEVEHGNVDNSYGSHVAPYSSAPKPNYVPPPQPSQTFAQPAPILRPRLMLMDQAYQKTPASDPNSPSVGTTGEGSVEEIVRNDNFRAIPQNDSSANVNKIYQQIMNQEPSVSSPRHFFPELNSPLPSSPSPGPFLKLIPTQEQQADSLQGLEQNIYKQGQALLQVQDWIQTLANRQQQQQQQLQQRKSPANGSTEAEIEDFDVNEFLNNNSVNSGQPTQHFPLPSDTANSGDYDLDNQNKRLIEEVDNNQQCESRKKARI